MGRDRPVSRKEGKGECNNEWGEGEKPGFVVVFFCFLQGEEDVAGKNGKDTETGRK